MQTDFFVGLRTKCTLYRKCMPKTVETQAVIAALDAAILLCSDAEAAGNLRTSMPAVIAAQNSVKKEYDKLSAPTKTLFIDNKTPSKGAKPGDPWAPKEETVQVPE